MSRRTVAGIALTLAFVALPTGLWGQHEDHGQSSDTDSGMMDRMVDRIMERMTERMEEMHGDGETSEMGGGMAGGMSGDHTVGPGPAGILGMVEELDLSADQIARLGEIRERLATTREEETAAAASAAESASLALQGEEPDFDEYEEALRTQADHQIQLRVARARAAVEARRVLDSAQIEELESSMGGGMMGNGGASRSSGGGGHSH